MWGFLVECRILRFISSFYLTEMPSVIQMCVDDYEFRHPSAKREKQCRRFVFRTSDGEERTFLVNISQFEQFGSLRLCEILMHLNRKGLNVKDYRFYLPKFNVSIEAGDKCQAPFDLFTDKEIIFQMQLIDDEGEHEVDKLYNPSIANDSGMDIEENGEYCRQCCAQNELVQPSSPGKRQVGQYRAKREEKESFEEEGEQMEEKMEPNAKKSKKMEKTILEALIKTKQWRTIHEKLSISLKNAAAMVGVPKKTLDDYFLAFRVAEHYGYDIQGNIYKKIGHMRNYIRQQPIKLKGRQPKVIKSFDLIPESDLSQVPQINDWSKMDHIEEEGSSSRQPSESVKSEQEDSQEMM